MYAFHRIAILAFALVSACGSRLSISSAPLPPHTRTDDRTISIATFNICDFGPKKAANAHVMFQLAAIVRGHDIVAIQEISDASGEVPRLLAGEVHRSGGPDYRALVSPRAGQQHWASPWIGGP